MTAKSGPLVLRFWKFPPHHRHRPCSVAGSTNGDFGNGVNVPSPCPWNVCDSIVIAVCLPRKVQASVIVEVRNYDRARLQPHPRTETLAASANVPSPLPSSTVTVIRSRICDDQIGRLGEVGCLRQSSETRRKPIAAGPVSFVPRTIAGFAL